MFLLTMIHIDNDNDTNLGEMIHIDNDNDTHLGEI